MTRLMDIPVCANTAAWSPVSDEQALIEQARHDRDAFAVLYRRHYGPIAGYLYRRTACRHTTEDLVSDVFLTALRELPRFEQRGVPLRAWLYRIASNAANRWARRRRWRIFRPLEAEPASKSDRDPAEQYDGADRERARRALLKLSPKHQTVLALHYLESQSVEDIATIVGCRVGTVKSRLSRARAALREQLRVRR